MLYELATGQRPFLGDTSLSVLSRGAEGAAETRHRAQPRAATGVRAGVKTCLQKDPERRYQSAKDLRNELQTLKEELDSGELGAARRDSSTARERWPISRGRHPCLGDCARPDGTGRLAPKACRRPW